MALPLVAILGRPNVGKSTLFNRITGTRAAVVHEEAGVTRDRHLHRADWNGQDFLLADTGGMVPFHEESGFDSIVTEVARETLAIAQAAIFVVDVGSGLTELDQAIVRELRGVDIPVFVAANKADDQEARLAATEFYGLGLSDEIYPISALHGLGTGDLLDDLVAALPARTAHPDGELSIALVGRPNVGKSSLLNSLVGAQRTIVSDTAGTTRDAIDTFLKWHGHDLVLIDTAGIRRKFKHQKGVEYFSVLRAVQAVERCDVAVLLLDAETGLVAQDARVAGEIHQASKGCVIALNKWDAVEKDDRTYLKMEQEVRDRLPFLSYAPVLTISALEKQRIGKVLEMAWDVGQTRQKTVETSRVNDIIQRAQAKNPPKVHNRGTGKIYYATQTGTAPPTFTLFVNRPAYFARHYVRYLNNQLRKEVGFLGTRIRFALRERS